MSLVHSLIGSLALSPSFSASTFQRAPLALDHQRRRGFSSKSKIDDAKK